MALHSTYAFISNTFVTCLLFVDICYAFYLAWPLNQRSLQEASLLPTIRCFS